MARRDDLQVFGEVMRDFRVRGGETQEDFAARTGLDRGLVGSVERGERNLGHRNLRKYLVGLGRTWGEWGQAMQRADRLSLLSAADRTARVEEYRKKLREARLEDVRGSSFRRLQG